MEKLQFQNMKYIKIKRKNLLKQIRKSTQEKQNRKNKIQNILYFLSFLLEHLELNSHSKINKIKNHFFNKCLMKMKLHFYFFMNNVYFNNGLI